MVSFLKSAHVPSDTGEVPELDVTPVMNMFIILIPFLVSMAVFTHLAIIDFSLPPNVGSGLDESDGKPTLKLTVVVAPGYAAVTLGENMLDSIPRTDGEYDFAALKNALIVNKQKADIQDEIIVAVRDNIRFKHVVKVMDTGREAGFDKIGLSSAAQPPEGTAPPGE